MGHESWVFLKSILASSGRASQADKARRSTRQKSFEGLQAVKREGASLKRLKRLRLLTGREYSDAMIMTEGLLH